MKTLLWKDFRLNRSLIISSVVIAVSIYVIGIIIEIAAHWPVAPAREDWGDMLNSYGGVSLFMTCCIAALFSGNAIACERAERSSHFLAYLPPTKGEILASKFVVAGGATAVVWGWALLSIYVIAPSFSKGLNADGPQIVDLLSMCLLIFGVGWMLSARLEKPLFPMIGALASPVALTLAVAGIAEVWGFSNQWERRWEDVAAVCLAVLAFGAGTWSYCRRVEP